MYTRAFLNMRVLVAQHGQGNMRDTLFRHILSGADLMTRDLKIHATEGGREEGEDKKGPREGGSSWRRKAAGCEENGQKLQQNKAAWQMQMLAVPHVSLASSLRLVLTWPQPYPSAAGGSSFLPPSSPRHAFTHFFISIIGAHRSWLIKGRTRQDNGRRRRSPEKDGEPGSERRTGRWRQNSSVGEDRWNGFRQFTWLASF